jgi:hypothetical protein
MFRDDNLDTVSDTRRVSDPMGTGTEIIFYPWVAHVSDPN